MTDHLRLHDEGDEAIVRGLRRLYAAPADVSYWEHLERRILARIADPDATRIAWWDELDRWMRPALVAAAVVLLATGVAMFRAYQAEQEFAYEAMLTPTTLPVETAVRPMLQGREGTFRYLMTTSR